MDEFVRDGFDDFDLFETCEEYYGGAEELEYVEDSIPEWDELIGEEFEPGKVHVSMFALNP